MDITCRSCGRNEVILPLWVKTTFKFLDDGSITILHVKPLESLEDKLVDSNGEMTCKHCGSNDIKIEFNQHEQMQTQDSELAALESL